MSSLVLTALPYRETTRAGDDLAGIAVAGAAQVGIELRAGDALVFAQKVVSKSENLFASLVDVVPSNRAVAVAEQCGKDARLVELVLRESSEVVRCGPGVLLTRHVSGVLLANAGIDLSNVESDARELVLLLPRDPDESARRLWVHIRDLTGVEIGIVINDSLGRAWRMGSTGTAIGAAGLPTLIDLRGRPDRNGRALQSTMVGAADELAAGASLLMGQAAESRPIIHVRGFPYSGESSGAAALLRPAEEDLFR